MSAIPIGSVSPAPARRSRCVRRRRAATCRHARARAPGESQRRDETRVVAQAREGAVRGNLGPVFPSQGKRTIQPRERRVHRAHAGIQARELVCDIGFRRMAAQKRGPVCSYRFPALPLAMSATRQNEPQRSVVRRVLHQLSEQRFRFSKPAGRVQPSCALSIVEVPHACRRIRVRNLGLKGWCSASDYMRYDDGTERRASRTTHHSAYHYVGEARRQFRIGPALMAAGSGHLVAKSSRQSSVL